tara:strand:+ start:1876 stop:2208 length:333 start_codon:yes stop_codon:yes gene_type:complete
MLSETSKECPKVCNYCYVHPLKIEITGGLDEYEQETKHVFDHTAKITTLQGVFKSFQRQRELSHKRWYYCEISGIEWSEEESFHKGVIYTNTMITSGDLKNNYMSQGEQC